MLTDTPVKVLHYAGEHDEAPFGFQCKKKMIIIITANFKLEIRNDFWTVRVISLGKSHESRGNSFFQVVMFWKFS